MGTGSVRAKRVSIPKGPLEAKGQRWCCMKSYLFISQRDVKEGRASQRVSEEGDKVRLCEEERTHHPEASSTSATLSCTMKILGFQKTPKRRGGFLLSLFFIASHVTQVTLKLTYVAGDAFEILMFLSSCPDS